MSSIRLLCLVATLLFGFATARVNALEVQACLDATNIAADPANCPNSLNAISASLSIQGPATSTGTPTGNPLVMTKFFDRSSANLLVYTATGRHFRGLLVVYFEGGAGIPRGRRLLSILLEDVIVVQLEAGAQDSAQTGAAPIETVRIGYSRVRIRDDVGGAQSCFDFRTRTAC